MASTLAASTRVIRGLNFAIRWSSSGSGQFGPVQRALEKGLRPGGHGGQNRLQVGHQNPEQVDAQGAHQLYLLLATLLPGHQPRLVLVDELVGHVRQRHDFANGLVELPLLVESGDLLTRGQEPVHHFRLAATVAEPVVEALAQEPRAAGRYIDDLADHVGIHPLHEVLKIEVDVVYPGAEFGGEIVPQVLRVQVFQVGAGLDEGAATLGHLGAVHGQKTVGT